MSLSDFATLEDKASEIVKQEEEQKSELLGNRNFLQDVVLPVFLSICMILIAILSRTVWVAAVNEAIAASTTQYAKAFVTTASRITSTYVEGPVVIVDLLQVRFNLLIRAPSFAFWVPYLFVVPRCSSIVET